MAAGGNQIGGFGQPYFVKKKKKKRVRGLISTEGDSTCFGCLLEAGCCEWSCRHEVGEKKSEDMIKTSFKYQTVASDNGAKDDGEVV